MATFEKNTDLEQEITRNDKIHYFRLRCKELPYNSTNENIIDLAINFLYNNGIDFTAKYENTYKIQGNTKISWADIFKDINNEIIPIMKKLNAEKRVFSEEKKEFVKRTQAFDKEVKIFKAENPTFSFTGHASGQ